MQISTSIALALDVREQLDRLAAREDRSRSYLVNALLRQAIAARAPVLASAEQSASKELAA